MPKKLIKKIQSFISGIAQPAASHCRTISRDDHHFPEEDISRGTLGVLEKLTEAGYEAYLVGGSIRDGLVGLHPKDFDVATNATPEEIKDVFQRQCRLIGRRFRLAHVRQGREVIEVATFRANHAEENGNDKVSRQSEDGLLLRDNVFGSLEDDAVRRDFTANALYYRHTDGAVLDFVGGYKDIEARTLRLIGDPIQRYREDPVRMLRAARFAAKLGFEIETSTAAPIRELSELLYQIPPARLFEELLKLLLGGYAQQVWPLLMDYRLAERLLPLTTEATQTNPVYAKMVDIGLHNTDARLAIGKHVTPAFIFAVFLWGPMQIRAERLRDQGQPPGQAMAQASQQVITEQARHTAIPKRFSIPMREMWDLQHRLNQRTFKRCQGLMEHPRFRAAYDLLLLREAAGEVPAGIGEWWTAYQTADMQTREQMCQQLGSQRKPKRRRRTRRPGGNRRPSTN